MRHTYSPKGVCSHQMIIDVEEEIITNVEIIGGCAGNIVGISNLIKGMHMDEAIKRLKGIPCGGRGTSCPDQLALALEQMKQK